MTELILTVENFRLPNGFKFLHASLLPHPSRPMQLLGAAIVIYFRAVQGVRYQFRMSNTAALQFIYVSYLPRPLTIAR